MVVAGSGQRTQNTQIIEVVNPNPLWLLDGSCDGLEATIRKCSDSPIVRTSVEVSKRVFSILPNLLCRKRHAQCL
jgi:hypothetical protein